MQIPRFRSRFGSTSRALVVDSHATARSVLASQLRALGIEQVTQCGRANEVRSHMAARSYDVLVCEHSLADGTLGQELIDELRRGGLLGLGTVVLMLSSSSSYQVVSQVAESALDGFIIKPYSVGDLEDRVLRAFTRKESLKDILDAVDDQRWADGLALCEARFGARGPHWTAAARIGAEIAIRQNRLPLASTMFEAVIGDRAVPWAKLGIARVLEASAHHAEALSTLEQLLASEPTYADAYDVLGRIYTEQGNFGAAITAFRQAAAITPNSVPRAQKYAILSHHAGDPEEARTALERAVTVGLHSPQFDHQALLALTVCHYRDGDAGALRQCRQRLDDAAAQGGALARDATVDALRRQRLQRLGRLAQGFEQLLGGDTQAALAQAGEIAAELLAPVFDAEAANNLLALLAAVVATGGMQPQAAGWVHQAGLRFCVSKHATELLVKACDGAPEHAELLRAAHAQIGETTRAALSEGLAGRHRHAVTALLDRVERTLNLKLIEVADATLARYREHIADADALAERLDVAKERSGRTLRTRLLAEVHGTLTGL